MTDEKWDRLDVLAAELDGWPDTTILATADGNASVTIATIRSLVAAVRECEAVVRAEPMTEATLRAAIDGATDLVNPRLSEVDWECVAACFDEVAAVRERDELRETLREIADWDAHDEDCATIDSLTGKVTDKDCSCGWVEVADHAREALGLDPIGYPQSRAALHHKDGAS